MGRRNHLLRIALAANQNQIAEAWEPTESESETLDSKNDRIHRFDLAQGAILNAIGFKSDEARKKELESQENEILTISSALQICNYIFPIPFACQRNQIMTFQTFNQSYLSLLRGSWRTAGWSLLLTGHPSILVYQLGYSTSMHYLQPRIVHKFRKLYPVATDRSLQGLCVRLGVSMGVNLASWFVLYPFWRHAILQTLLWVPYWELFPSRRDFFPRHHWKTFFLSYFYHFGIWLFQINVYKAFQKTYYPASEDAVTLPEGTYPSALTAAVSDILPMIFGLGVEIVLLRGLARDFGPKGLVLNTFEPGNVGLLVKALAAEWAVEWTWLEIQYWVTELYGKFKRYQE